MGKAKRTVFTCDGCGAIVVPDNPATPQGFVGKITQHDNAGRVTGGVSNVDWFACKSECVGRAALKAHEESVRDAAGAPAA